MADSPVDEIAGFAAGTWEIDPAASEAAFSLRHNTVARARGSFARFSGTIVTEESYGRSSASATVEAASVRTGGATGDRHIRSERFLDAEAFPYITFTSSHVESDGAKVYVDGQLTIRGTSQRLRLEVEVGDFTTDLDGRTRAHFSATAEISRRAYGVHPKAPLRFADNGLVLGDRVTITLKIVAVLQSGLTMA